MGVATKTSFIAGGTGTVLIFAAQTKPKDAATNIAAWIKALGVDDAPSLLSNANADTWAMALGLVLVLGAIGYWLRRGARLQAACAPARLQESALGLKNPLPILTGLGEGLAKAPPEAPRAAVEAPLLTQLVARKADMERRREQVSRALTDSAAAINDYRVAIAELSRGQVLRPHVGHGPRVEIGFRNATEPLREVTDNVWMALLSAPHMVVGDYFDRIRGYSVTSYEPESNKPYLRAHRENIALIQEQHSKLRTEQAHLQHALEGVNEQIANEGRRLNEQGQ